MDPLQIALIVLALVAIWAVIEVALTVRRSRGTLDEVDRAVGRMDKTMDGVDDVVVELKQVAADAQPVLRHLDEAIVEARPVIAHLDDAAGELQPVAAQLEPLLKSATVAVDALSANLVEVEGVVRDVSAVTGAAASAGNAVSGITDSATGVVNRIIGKFKPRDEETPALEEPINPAPAASHAPAGPREVSVEPSETPKPSQPDRYFTYAATDDAPATGAEPTADVKENSHA